MVKKLLRRTKIIIIDVLGILLLLGALAFGWVPGPGGIPLLLAGLGLLSINHEWAKRWMENIKSHGFHIMDKVFVDRPVWKAAYDMVSLTFIAGGIYLINTHTKNLTLTIAVFLILTGSGLFLDNRKRLDSILAKARYSRKHKNK